MEVAGVSATQAILRYRSPNSRICAVEVSEQSGLVPLVHDVDPALFAGSGTDSRPGGLNRPGAHVFVVGRRKAERALNGRWYSRALQANTDHYFRVRCGGATAAGSFRTATIALGNTYNEMFPPDPDVAGYRAAGGYAWPEFVSWTERNESVVDPQTGILLKRVTMPQDFPINWLGSESIGTAIDFDGKWSNPDAAKADDSAAAVFPGGGTNWLFLRDDGLTLGDSATATLGYLGRTIDSVQVTLKAWCSGACADEDRKVELCLTVNGAGCAGAIREQTLGTAALNAGSAALTVGTTTPILDYWTAPGSPPPDRTQFMVRTGTADINGRSVTWRGGNYFNMSWTAGSRIALNGREYEIASVEGLKALTLKSDAGTASGAGFRAANAGVMLRKKTASRDSISVQYAALQLGVSHLPEGWPASGSPEICQPVVTKDAAGNEGYRCVIQDAVPVVYWINRKSGESKLLGLFTTDSQAGADGWSGGFCNGWFSVAEPDAFYCLTGDNAAAHQVLIKCKLTGSNETGGWKPVCANLGPGSQGGDVGAQLAAFTGGQFDAGKFQCGVAGIQNERILVACTRAGQDSLGWLAVMDPAKAQPVCGTGSNCIVGAHNTWSVAPARWCALHTPFYMGAVDWYWVAGKFLEDGGGPGQGPYVSRIASGGLAAGNLAACPANAVEAAVAGKALCSTVTVDGEPRDPSPHGGETGAAGELQNAEPGDVLRIDGELTELLAKNGNAWVLRRGYGVTQAQDHGAGAVLSEQCLAQWFERATSSWSWSWDYLHDPRGTNAQGTTVRKEMDFDHPAGRSGVVVGGLGYPLCVWSGGCYGARTSGVWGGLADVMVNGNAGFAGVPAGAAGNFAEDHASYAQVSAAAGERQWMLDGRPLQPGPDFSPAFTPMGGALYKLSTTTRDGDELRGAVRLSRLKAPTFAFCGTQPLRDASSAATGDVFSAGAADWYKYCVSRKADECRLGAQAGDIWVNCPVVTTPGCTYLSEQGNVTAGICVTVPHMYLSSIGQIGFGSTDATGSLGRKLTMGLSRNLLVDPYWNVRALPDASWMLFRSVWLGGLRTEALLAKLPPYPEPDGIDRSDFVGLTVTATGRVVAGTDNVVVEFGYAENGEAGDYYCTSRREACVKGSASGYGLAGDPVAGVPCTGACSVTVPGISGRAMYYRIVYRDGQNRVLARSSPAATIVP